MGVLQFTSNIPGSGKTSIAAALILAAYQAGRKAAYFKPFSANPGADGDVALMRELARGASDLEDVPAPLPEVPDREPSSAQSEQLRDATANLRSSHDIVLLETNGQNPALAGSIANIAECRTILLYGAAGNIDAAEVAAATNGLGGGLAGVIVNGVTKHRLSEVRSSLATAINAMGVPLLGIVPELRAMRAPTVQQVAETLQGRWVQEPDSGDVLIEQFLIGGNIMDSGREYYGRHSSQAVITRCQRTDIQLACLMPGTKCLVLTEGGEPAEYIKAEAMQRQVPVLVVDSNTSETAEALSPLLSGQPALTPSRIKSFAQCLPDYLDMERLMEAAL